MLEEAGRDATEAFEDVGHSDEARELLGPMFLGDFVGEVCQDSVHSLSFVADHTLDVCHYRKRKRRACRPSLARQSPTRPHRPVEGV